MYQPTMRERELVVVAKQMRTKQKQYFRGDRRIEVLRESQFLERKLDQLLDAFDSNGDLQDTQSELFN